MQEVSGSIPLGSTITLPNCTFGFVAISVEHVAVRGFYVSNAQKVGFAKFGAFPDSRYSGT